MEKHKTRGLFLRIVRRILKTFKKKVEVIKLFVEEYEETAMFICNHSGASGPMNLSIYFDEYFRPLGTFEMVGSYKERWNYLYYIFYQKKLKYNRIKSFILATLLAIISKILYNDIGLIPTYPDARFITTIRKSIEALKNKQSILIFPEDSSEEYATEIGKFLAGFIVIVRKFFEETGIDLPIYPMYFSKLKGKIVVGEKEYIQPLVEKNLDNNEIAEYFKNKVNAYGKMIYNEEIPS